MSQPKLLSASPPTAVPGGLLELRCQLPAVDPTRVRVQIGDAFVAPLGVSADRVLVKVPAVAGRCSVVLDSGGKASRGMEISVARLLASGLHPVASPAIDSDGSIYTTLSGPRGESVPFSVFKIDSDGSKEPYLAELINPTGLAFGPEGLLYITSRHTGTVYRVGTDRQIVRYVEGLGVATGLAFDSRGILYVGDRSGFIYRVEPPDGKLSVLCELEPSVSAYHLQVDASGSVFVSGPTLSAQDSIYRVSPDGKIGVFCRGFGRPQGMALRNGDLYVAASHRGRRGIFRVRAGQVEQVVASPMLVGLAFGPAGELVVADSSSIYRFDVI